MRAGDQCYCRPGQQNKDVVCTNNSFFSTISDANSTGSRNMLASLLLPGQNCIVHTIAFPREGFNN